MVSSIGGYNPLQHALSQLFAKNDSNADGNLDSGEIQSLLDTLQGGDASGSSGSLTADNVISAFDTNGDGQVSQAEFDAKFQKLAGGLQGSLISAQESAQTGGPGGVQGGGHHHHHHGGKVDGDSSLLDLLDGTDDSTDASTTQTADASTTSGSTADSSSTDASGNDLLQTLLSQLGQYAQTQEAFGFATAQPGFALSETA